MTEFKILWNSAEKLQKLLQKKRHLWGKELIGNDKNKFRLGVGQKTSGKYGIALIDHTPTEHQSDKLIFVNYTVVETNVKGSKSYFLRAGGRNCFLCFQNIKDLPDEWTVQIKLWCAQLTCADMIEQRSIDFNDIGIHVSSDENNYQDSHIMAVNWTLDNLENRDDLTPGDCIASKPFGFRNGDIAMNLHIYPKGKSGVLHEPGEIRFSVTVLHVPESVKTENFSLKFKLFLNGQSIKDSNSSLFKEGDSKFFSTSDCTFENGDPLKVTFQIEELELPNEKLKNTLREAVILKHSSQVENILLDNTFFLVSEDVFKLCLKDGDLISLEVLLRHPNIRVQEDTIKEIAQKHAKKQKFMERIVQLLLENVRSPEMLKLLIENALDNFAVVNNDRSYPRRIIAIESFREVAIKHIDNIYTEMQPWENAEFHEDSNWLDMLVAMIKYDDVGRFKSIHSCGHVEKLWEVLSNSEKNESMLSKLGHRVIVFQLGNTFSFNTFPILCVQYGKFKLVQAYFSIVKRYDNFLHAVYIISKLGETKKKAVLNDIQKKDLSETKAFLDRKVTTLFEDIILNSDGENLEMVQKYIDRKTENLENKSVMDILIENDCTSFIKSDFSENAVENLWSQSGSKLGRLLDPEIKLLYLLFALPIFLVGLISYLLVYALYIVTTAITIILTVSLIIPALIMQPIRWCRNRKVDEDQYSCFSRYTKSVEDFGRYIEKTLVFPKIRFCADTAMQVVFVAILSYFVVSDVHFYTSKIEYGLWIYSLSCIVEEISQLVKLRCQDYFDIWNSFDWCAILFLITGLLMKEMRNYSTFQQSWQLNNCTSEANVTTTEDCLLLEANDKWLYIVRTLLVLASMFSFLKLLRFTSAYKKFGPTLTMIGRMIIDNLLPFLFILAVIIMAFGVAFSALTYPNDYTAKGMMFSFYGIAGQYLILELIANKESDDAIQKPHEWSHYTIVHFMLPIYIVIVNVLLLNLLIALFGGTVAKIEQDSKAYWHILKYRLVKDYETRSVLPPPLNILNLAQNILILIFKPILYDRKVLQEKKKLSTNEKTMWLILFAYVQAKSFKNKQEEEKRMCEFSKENLSLLIKEEVHNVMQEGEERLLATFHKLLNVGT